MKKEKMSPIDLQMARSEIDIIRICHHENVVSLIDSFENATNIYIVMEYINGKDLSDYVLRNQDPISEAKAKTIMSQLSSGVKYLHQLGIVHRDLKPENILISDRDSKLQLKILDFGLSKIMSLTERTVDGVGTIYYIAPEVLLREPYNYKADIWSLGIILYFVLTKCLPFDSSNDAKIGPLIVHSEAEFPDRLWEKRSKQSIALTKLCLFKSQERRINIDQFIGSNWFK